jgi:transposase
MEITMTKRANITAIDQAQPIYMGMDIHKRRWSICLIHKGVVIKKITIDGKFEVLKSYLKGYEGFNIKSVYEAGFCGFHVHRKLRSISIENIVISPNKMPKVVGDKVKTDRKDSEKLARYHSQGLLEAIYIPEDTEIERRQIVRTREQYKNKRIRAILQMKGMLNLHGIDIPKGKLSQVKLEGVLELKLPESLKMCLQLYVEEIMYLDGVLKKLDTALKNESDKPEVKEHIEIIRSVPGVGPLTAATLAFEIGSWNRFSNTKQISAYLGLTPSEYSSGDHVRRGRITGQGRNGLRAMLIEASWILTTKDEEMRETLNRIAKQTGSKKKAIVAVARKLICRLHSMIRTKQMYRINANLITAN